MKLILKAVSQKYGGIFDGLSSDACFTDYVNRQFDKFPECVTGGYMHFEYSKRNETLHVITEYETTRKLTKEEEQQVIDYTQGQWSDGIGEGFEQQEFAGQISPFAHYGKEETIYNPSPWHNGQRVTIEYK